MRFNSFLEIVLELHRQQKYVTEPSSIYRSSVSNKLYIRFYCHHITRIGLFTKTYIKVFVCDERTERKPFDDVFFVQRIFKTFFNIFHFLGSRRPLRLQLEEVSVLLRRVQIIQQADRFLGHPAARSRRLLFLYWTRDCRSIPVRPSTHNHKMPTVILESCSKHHSVTAFARS